ncbi:hypothetical protein E2C01_009762 [Portunus trituberculatus]|uniref:Uncharacterized protein n=1 Tax=Portunus trituberculatus TaxID=210409 RepID=A0A5B7D6M9_PORTR|nr:hypothetical protein [Portunus trituberculatus]
MNTHSGSSGRSNKPPVTPTSATSSSGAAHHSARASAGTVEGVAHSLSWASAPLSADPRRPSGWASWLTWCGRAIDHADPSPRHCCCSAASANSVGRRRCLREAGRQHTGERRWPRPGRSTRWPFNQPGSA